jgi:tetratricopeptide (TPR) repeat protein
VHGDIYWQDFDHTPARLDLCYRAVQTALRIQPDAGEAHLALANYYYHGLRDFGRARTELAIARGTLPNEPEVLALTGYINRREGRWEEATRNLERAMELDPRNIFTLQQLAQIYAAQRRYADELRIYDRILAIVPGDPESLMYRTWVAFNWRADIKPAQVMLAKLTAADPGVAASLDDPGMALCERTATAAARGLANFPAEGAADGYGVNIPHAYWEGVVARWQGDIAKTRAAFAAARDEVRKALEKEPGFAAALALLGLIDAGLGRKEDAIREGQRACELLPISKDAVTGVAIAAKLAQIYTWTGEKDLAIEQLDASLRVPNDCTSYGDLRLSPLWDPLRGDPRFEKIVASLAPADMQH